MKSTSKSMGALRAKYRIKSNESYFARCERDDEGRCLPSGMVGEEGSEQPGEAAEARKEESKQEVNETMERAVEHARDMKEGVGDKSRVFTEYEKSKASAWAAKKIIRRRELTEREKTAVAFYRKKGAVDINRMLRLGDDRSGLSQDRVAKAKEEVPLLDSAIAASEVTEDVTAFRGLRMPQESVSSLKVGEVIRDPGFVSTTLVQYNSKLIGFTKPVGAGDVDYVPVVMEIRVPQGAKGLYLKERGEAELLLRRNSRFRVVEEGWVSKHDMVPHVYRPDEPKNIRRLVVELLPGGDYDQD